MQAPFEDEATEPAAPEGPLVRVRLTIAYHGSGFRGMATQPGQRTVGGVLSETIEKVVRAPVTLAVAGRTDAGVHAWGQVVAFDMPEGREQLDVGDLGVRLNRMLNPEIVVRAAAVAPRGFDPRRDATGRRYHYTVLNRLLPDPWLATTAWWVASPLDLRTMRAGCAPLIGEHDFSAFCRRQGEASLVRLVREAEWLDLGDGLLRFEIEASSFCQQMVRSIVGTLVDAGRGRRTAADVATALRVKDRARAGPVAPPHGLCLREVTY
ncbi:MAG: tRNA pseudouridine(38-40) synthase [uncultured Acidimicrobiales bacterium]|uniref:tRNA pseudouridine synthase A n=1 Tax=uncultured Acidimicrobiales bacterium TaxID=310071 RepID=A0A6J4HW10_9ACTN|nr:MAG: tRNA pseudouridine(38-40) synthase [uncultured Acidimicrobiales bacterium]